MKNSSELILAIESAGATCGVALSGPEGLLAEYSLFTPHTHDRMLAELCRRVLSDNGFAVTDLAAVAVSAGPGSFTGLRIGAGVAKGMCFDGRPGLIGVPSLSALAAAADEFALSVGAKQIIPVIASHRDLSYYQVFTPLAEAQGGILLAKTEEINALIDHDTVICGPGSAAFSGGRTLSGLQRLTPRFVARLARRFLAEGRFEDPLEFVPLYVQEFVPRTP